MNPPRHQVPAKRPRRAGFEQFLPETKGLSVEQAVEVFEKEAEASKAYV